jgi:hypothetical protein
MLCGHNVEFININSYGTESKQEPGWLSRYCNSLQAGRSGDRIPVGERFSAPIQASSVAHPASCTMGTGSFLGGKSGRGVALTPPTQSSAEVEERVELYLRDL